MKESSLILAKISSYWNKRAFPCFLLEWHKGWVSLQRSSLHLKLDTWSLCPNSWEQGFSQLNTSPRLPTLQPKPIPNLLGHCTSKTNCWTSLQPYLTCFFLACLAAKDVWRKVSTLSQWPFWKRAKRAKTSQVAAVSALAVLHTDPRLLLEWRSRTSTELERGN